MRVHEAMWAVLAAVVWVCALATPLPLHLERDSFRRPRPDAPYHHLDVADTWQKRDHHDASPDATQTTSSQLMLRSPRGSRQYDVPQIGESHLCPKALFHDVQLLRQKRVSKI